MIASDAFVRWARLSRSLTPAESDRALWEARQNTGNGADLFRAWLAESGFATWGAAAEFAQTPPLRPNRHTRGG